MGGSQHGVKRTSLAWRYGMSLLTVASVGMGPHLADAQESSVAFRNQQTLWGKMSVVAQPAATISAADDAPEPSDISSLGSAPANDSASVTVTGVTSTGKVAPLSAQRLTVTATDDGTTRPSLPIVHPSSQYVAPKAPPQYSREVVDSTPVPVVVTDSARRVPSPQGVVDQRFVDPARASHAVPLTQPARPQSNSYNRVGQPVARSPHNDPRQMELTSSQTLQSAPVARSAQASSAAPMPMPISMPTAAVNQPGKSQTGYPNYGQAAPTNSNSSYRTTRVPAVTPETNSPAQPQFNFFNVVKRTPSVSNQGGQPALGTSHQMTAAEVPNNSRYDRVSFALQDAEAPPEPPVPSGSAGQQGNSSLSGDDAKLGSEPPSNELVFLRRQTVLLAAGEAQFDVGFAYSNLDDDRPLPILNGGGDVIGVVEARTRQRLLVVPFEVRYGLTDRIQLFANTAVGWANAELGTNGLSVTQDVGGIADTSLGMSMLLRAGECDSPDVVFTLGMTAPTGNDTLITSNLVPNSQLGQGFWAAFASLLFVHTWDPMVVFYGVGYNHRFDGEFVGINVDPGEEFDYQLGAGFAVNSNVSLSASFLGAYITEARVNGDLIEGSTLEPMRTRLAITVAGRNGKIWEPFAEIPMTEDAAARVGMTWTY